MAEDLNIPPPEADDDTSGTDVPGDEVQPNTAPQGGVD
jgi:hypothetical protein